MSTATFSPSYSTTTTSTTTSTEATPDRRAGRVTWKRGVATGFVAAVAATAVAAAFQAAGHALAVTDGAIPVLAFGQMVLLATVVGIVVARHTSRTTFYRVTVALTVLSCVPDLALGDGVVSKAGLMLTHVVAATIIIPRFARR
jgi:Family of unknown function (DUF6069)